MVITAEADAAAARAAAGCVVEIHRRIVDQVRVGMTLGQVDALVADALADLGCVSAFLGYSIHNLPPFPSHACLSVNDCIVHGTHEMSSAPLRTGDLVKIDVGVVRDGWIGDAAWTYAIEDATDEALDLMRAGREALTRGLKVLTPEHRCIDWARAVEQCVQNEYGYYLPRSLTGHSYGRRLHERPIIYNVTPSHAEQWPDADTEFQPGMLLALEPIVTASTADITSAPQSWPIFTADGGLSVHYEANVMVSEGEAELLTAGLLDLPHIVG